MNRSREYNRWQSRNKAIRKHRIDREIWHSFNPVYDNLHQYSKNKIHCSCPLCSSKTKNKGKRRGKVRAPLINYSISDIKRLNKLNYKEDCSDEED